MDKAVAAAREAFDKGAWPRLSHAERAVYLRKLAGVLREREPELAAAWTEQVGGLATFAPIMAGGATARFEIYAGMAGSYPFETRQPGTMGGTAILRREPVGVVVADRPSRMHSTPTARPCSTMTRLARMFLLDAQIFPPRGRRLRPAGIRARPLSAGRHCCGPRRDRAQTVR